MTGGDKNVLLLCMASRTVEWLRGNPLCFFSMGEVFIQDFRGKNA